MNYDPVQKKTQSNNKQSKSWLANFKDILDK